MILTWTVPASFGSCGFDVFRSDTEYGPWEKLNENKLVDIASFLITRGVKDSKFISNFFVVECTPTIGRKIKSEVITLDNKRSTWVELRAREIQRREWLLLRKFVGVKTLIFRRKTFGKRCPECWDEKTGKTLKDNCPTCLGTSFEGGYFPGHPTLFQYEPTSNNAVFGYQGKVESNQIPAWTISYPTIATFDLVLRVPDSKIYRVDLVQTTELQTVTVRQLMTLTELSKNNIEYKLIP